MQKKIESHIPEAAIAYVVELLKHEKLNVIIKNERKTRHGDYRKISTHEHQITINNNLNRYRFLITLIHEIAHFHAFETYGRQIKPHGKEWKMTFQHLMLPLLHPAIFPLDLLPLLAKHFKNPKASSDTDIQLAFALKQFDPPTDKSYVFELPIGSRFKMHNGRVFKKGEKRRTRYEGLEIATGKLYLFNPNAEVELVD